ncbi:MAG: hypothetical protein NXI24_13660 [bacterium]|nr:hypothetical protein [bacterium]
MATLSYEHDDIKLDRLNVSVKDDIEWNRELWFQDPMQRMRDMNAFSKVRFAGRNDEREPLHIHIRHRAENGAIDIVNAVKDMKADGFLD